MVNALRSHPSTSKLHLLVASSNSGSFTYDGIELGAERVTHEVEAALAQYAREGTSITKISVVGYSLGGLVARYFIGLLYSRGWFEDGKLTPMNFTTFATPHIGCRTPIIGYHSTVWNMLGARTLSMSGRQLFTIDLFRQTGRPLLAVLADRGSIFMRALSRFQVRSLYANIQNDRTAPFYTTGISRIDPYKNLPNLNLNYVPGYDNVILDSTRPILPEAQIGSGNKPSFLSAVKRSTISIARRIPLALAFVLFVPIFTIVFLTSSIVQTFRSARRIRLHEQGKAGIGLGTYRLPLMVEDMHTAMEEAMGDLAPASADTRRKDGDGREYLPASDTTSPKAAVKAANAELDESKQTQTFPVLALSKEQFEMIDSLDSDEVRFTKHFVHIHHVMHSHAAIIVRSPKKKAFREGKEVIRFWLENEFML